jgi:transposase InsO family protein
MKNERHLVSDNLDFDAGALDYKTRNNALIQIVIQALSDNHSYKYSHILLFAISALQKYYLKHEENKIYPYLLRGLLIDKVNQVWSTDITYIPMTISSTFSSY